MKNWKYILFLLILAASAVAVCFFLDPRRLSAPSSGAAPGFAADWKIYRAGGTSFKYPENFGANVWQPYFWPPKMAIVSEDQDPVKAGCSDMSAEYHEAVGVPINRQQFMLYKGEGVGAGSLYQSYCYVGNKKGKSYVLYFVIQSHTGCGEGMCGAYCGTENENECKALDRATMIEKSIEQMVATFQF